MPFLQTEYNQVVFVHNADDAIKKGILQENHAKIVVWGYRYQEDIQKILDQKIIPTIRIEDGFIRSFGLGKDFIPPFSLVFDKGNLYYNASDKNASDVHHLLQEKPIPYLEKIGNDILEAIRKDNITKYNIDHYCSVSFKTDKTILCVIGQVPNDASLQYGGLPEHIKNNTDLLKYARQHFPDHFILFKPHPDIMAGHVEGEDLAQIEKYADKVDLDHSLTSLIDASDHILTMTSLAGLEAIIRHKKVTVLGKPFYKGYGFCEGEQQTNMSLAHFIYKIYCDYPLYIDGGKGAYGHAKSIISKILRQKKAIENPLRHIHLSHIVWKRLYQIKKNGFLGNSVELEFKHDISKNVLLLQGPVGTFFDKLRTALRQQGAENIVKVNYNLADAFFYKTGIIEEFNQPMHHLPVFYKDLIQKYNIQSVYLFGDCRPIHKMAIEVFKAFNIDVYVFEEGYIRPRYITLEKGGVNGYSSMPRSLAQMRHVKTDQRELPHKQIGYIPLKR